MSEASNITAAQDVQHQYELYFTGLAFTLAALAIQTLAFSGNIFIDIIETVGIISVTLAGCLGLYRLHQFPILYRLYENIYNPKSYLNSGESAADVMRKKFKDDHESTTYKNWNANKWQRGAFVIGIVAILLARVGGQFMHTYYNANDKNCRHSFVDCSTNLV